FCFFFQAEDGIRDPLVTGVQTCALPISDNAESETGTHAGALLPRWRVGLTCARRASVESSFVDRQEPVIQRQRQERERRADRGAVLTGDAAVRLLSRLELSDEQFVPFLPRLDVAL